MWAITQQSVVGQIEVSQLVERARKLAREGRQIVVPQQQHAQVLPQRFHVENTQRKVLPSAVPLPPDRVQISQSVIQLLFLFKKKKMARGPHESQCQTSQTWPAGRMYSNVPWIWWILLLSNFFLMARGPHESQCQTN